MRLSEVDREYSFAADLCLIEHADDVVLDVMHSRAREQEVLDILDETLSPVKHGALTSFKLK